MHMSRLPAQSPVFKAFWHFAAERQAMYERRLGGESAPWSDDEVLSNFRFTNVFRASDRVSQYLLRHVIYGGSQTPDDVVFRILLFKLFNKIETWEFFETEFGAISLDTFDPSRATDLLTRARLGGRRIYSNAYIIPCVPGWTSPKHAGHLHLAMTTCEAGLGDRVSDSGSLRELFFLLRGMPGLGDFLAFQFAIDMAYSDVVNHDENEFVVAGPGALDGISKVFPGIDLKLAPQLIKMMTEEQDDWFTFFGLRFGGLFGRRLHLIDIQNLFCEISKYARVAHPDQLGVAGRTRIKQTFKPAGSLPSPYFPPKWGLRTDVCSPNRELLLVS